MSVYNAVTVVKSGEVVLYGGCRRYCCCCCSTTPKHRGETREESTARSIGAVSEVVTYYNNYRHYGGVSLTIDPSLKDRKYSGLTTATTMATVCVRECIWLNCTGENETLAIEAAIVSSGSSSLCVYVRLCSSDDEVLILQKHRDHIRLHEKKHECQVSAEYRKQCRLDIRRTTALELEFEFECAVIVCLSAKRMLFGHLAGCQMMPSRTDCSIESKVRIFQR